MRSASSHHHRRGGHSLVREVPVEPYESRHHMSEDIAVIRKHVVRMRRSDEPGMEDYNELEVDELRSGAVVIRNKSPLSDDRVFLYPSQVSGISHVLRKRRPRG